MRLLSVTETFSSSAPWPMKMGTCCAASGTACTQRVLAISDRSTNLARIGSSEVPCGTSVSRSDRALQTANPVEAKQLAEAVPDNPPEPPCERFHSNAAVPGSQRGKLSVCRPL